MQKGLPCAAFWLLNGREHFTRFAMKKWLLCAGLTAGLIGQSVQAQSPEEIAFARQILTQLQDNSFAANREYCGIIGLTADNKLTAATPRKGRRTSCQPRDPRDAAEIIASYHTHGGFDWDADSEVPSTRHYWRYGRRHRWLRVDPRRAALVHRRPDRGSAPALRAGMSAK